MNMTIDEYTTNMPGDQKIVVQNDGNNNFDYIPYIGTVMQRKVDI